MIVVDASVLIETLLRTPAAAAFENRLFEFGQTLQAPHLIDIEVVQVLRRFARTGQLDAARCHEALGDLLAFPLTRLPHEFLLPRVWELRDNFTAYDAVYVALAETLEAPLLTRDRRLAVAPGHRAHIDLV